MLCCVFIVTLSVVILSVINAVSCFYNVERRFAEVVNTVFL
jgi:hypothetical protein